MRFFNIIGAVTGAVFAGTTSPTVVETTTNSTVDDTDLDSALLRHEAIYSQVQPVEACYDYSGADMSVSNAERIVYEPMGDTDTLNIAPDDDLVLCKKVMLDYSAASTISVKYMQGSAVLDRDGSPYVSYGLQVDYSPDSLRTIEYKNNTVVPGGIVALFRAVTSTPMRLSDATRIILDDDSGNLTSIPGVKAVDLQTELANINEIGFTSSEKSVTAFGANQIVLAVRRTVTCGKVCFTCADIEFIGDGGYFEYRNSAGQEVDPGYTMLDYDTYVDADLLYANHRPLGAGLFDVPRANLSNCSPCETSTVSISTVTANDTDANMTQSYNNTNTTVLANNGISYSVSPYLAVSTLALTAIAYNSVASVVMRPIQFCINKMFGTIMQNDTHNANVNDEHTETVCADNTETITT